MLRDENNFFYTLIKTIKSLNLTSFLSVCSEGFNPYFTEYGQCLLILKNEIFMSEEEWENSPEIIEEVELARKAYEDGDFVTLEEFITNS